LQKHQECLEELFLALEESLPLGLARSFAKEVAPFFGVHFVKTSTTKSTKKVRENFLSSKVFQVPLEFFCRTHRAPTESFGSRQLALNFLSVTETVTD
jgi:hypothetical protein